jgi:hypothetical protein
VVRRGDDDHGPTQRGSRLAADARAPDGDVFEAAERARGFRERQLAGASGVLRRFFRRTHVIITGRDAPQELIDYADLVSEMREIKHPFQQGIKAQPGIEF